MPYSLVPMRLGLVAIIVTLVLTLFLGLLAAPLLVEAQQAEKVYRIGFLATGAVEHLKPLLAAFRQGLHELGYLEGNNIVIEERYAAGRRERLPALAAELVRFTPDVFLVHANPALVDRAAQAAGRTIPIVMAAHADPVGTGMVASLARPGGNITGLTDAHSDLVSKRLELLKEVVPSASHVAVLWNPAAPIHPPQWQRLQAAAPALGVTLLSLEVRGPEDFDRGFATMQQERPDALNVLGHPLFGAYRRQIAAFALQSRLPTMLTTEPFVEAGGGDVLRREFP